jgi:hypothetical protein
MEQKQSQWQGAERRHAQTQFQGEDRRKPEDDSIFEKTTWIPGGPVQRTPESGDAQQDEDPGGHA